MSSGDLFFVARMEEGWHDGIAKCSIKPVGEDQPEIQAEVSDTLGMFSVLSAGCQLIAFERAGKYYAIQAPVP